MLQKSNPALKTVSLLMAIAVLLFSCAKEPLDAPASSMDGVAKGLSPDLTSGSVSDTQNGGDGGAEPDSDDDDGISDDGDDVGDGERTKKKRRSN